MAREFSKKEIKNLKTFLKKSVKTPKIKIKPKAVGYPAGKYFLYINKYIFLNLFLILFMFIAFLLTYDYNVNVSSNSSVIDYVLTYLTKFALISDIVSVVKNNVHKTLAIFYSLVIPVVTQNIPGATSFLGYLCWVILTPRSYVVFYILQIWSLIYISIAKKHKWISVTILVVVCLLYSLLLVLNRTTDVPVARKVTPHSVG